MRRVGLCLTLLAATALSSLAVGAPAVSAHGARTPKYDGDAPGSVSCTLTATVTFSPPLTETGGATAPSKTKGSLHSCTTTNSVVDIKGATVTGSFAAAGSPSCSTLNSLATPATLTIRWHGEVDGTVGTTAYSGTANFTPSVIASPAERVSSTGGENNADDTVTLPATAHTAGTTGSFAGGVVVNTTADASPASLATVCRTKAEGGKGSGLKKIVLSGPVTFGASVGTPLSGVQALATDAGQSYCAVQSAGTIRCWGDNPSGELGDGTTTTSSVAMAVSGMTTAVGVSSDGDHSYCALLESGAVDCWGANTVGQLGDGSLTSSSVPVAVTGLTSVSALTSGGDNSYCALLDLGTVECWGANTVGQLGDGSMAASNVPVAVSSVTNATSVVSDGGDAYCVTLTTDTVDCWGSNALGQLGNGGTRNSDSPVDVPALTGVGTLSSDGDESFCALLLSGVVECWGANFAGELGNGTTASSTVPVGVTGVGNAVAVSDDGAEAYCAVLATGSVDCWGYNAFGQLGNGTTINSDVPVAVSSLTTATAVVSDGEDSFCVQLSSGATECWGANFSGELGNGSTTASSVPVAVSGLSFAVNTVGGMHPMGVGAPAYCTLLSINRVACWGANQFGQLGDATRTASSVPVFVTGP